MIIQELGLPLRAENALLRNRINTVAQLVRIGSDRVALLKGVGNKSLEDIKVALQGVGITWHPKATVLDCNQILKDIEAVLQSEDPPSVKIQKIKLLAG